MTVISKTICKAIGEVASTGGFAPYFYNSQKKELKMSV